MLQLLSQPLLFLCSKAFLHANARDETSAADPLLGMLRCCSLLLFCGFFFYLFWFSRFCVLDVPFYFLLNRFNSNLLKLTMGIRRHLPHRRHNRLRRLDLGLQYVFPSPPSSLRCKVLLDATSGWVAK